MISTLFKRRWPWLVAVPVLVIAIYHYTLGKHGIRGRVVDAETGQPIAGAVALCVWIEARWGIETTHHVVAVSESISDEQGRIKAGGTWRMFLDPPELTVYKRGYVAWNNLVHFPDYLKRRDFSWRNGFVAKMEKWKDGYSFNQHESFISNHAQSQTNNFMKAYEWETDLQVIEADRVNEELRRKGLRS